MLRRSNIKFGIAAVLVATLAALMVPAAANAATNTFPTGCKSMQSASLKHSVKVFRKYSYITPQKIECGNAKYGTGEDKVQDDNFANDDGLGQVYNVANLAKSLVMFNKSTNFGVCFVFYDGPNQTGNHTAFFVDKKSDGAKWRVAKVPYLYQYSSLEGRIESMKAFDSSWSYCHDNFNWGWEPDIAYNIY